MNLQFYQEVLQAIKNINEQAYEICADFPGVLNLRTDGEALIVEAFGSVLYNADDEPRAFDEPTDSYEPIEPFLLQKLKVLLAEFRLIDLDGQGEHYEKLVLQEEAYRTAISTFLDEADAGGTPSYDSLRAVLKQYNI